MISLHYRCPGWLTTYSIIHWYISDSFTTFYFVWHSDNFSRINSPLLAFSQVIFKHNYWIETIKLRNGKSDITGNIQHKNMSKNCPIAEKTLSHISKTSASNINLSSVYETIKKHIVKKKQKIVIISKLSRKLKMEILINPLMKYWLFKIRH